VESRQELKKKCRDIKERSSEDEDFKTRQKVKTMI